MRNFIISRAVKNEVNISLYSFFLFLAFLLSKSTQTLLASHKAFGNLSGLLLVPGTAFFQNNDIFPLDKLSALKFIFPTTCRAKHLTFCFRLSEVISLSSKIQFGDADVAEFIICTTDKFSQNIMTRRF